MLLKGPVKDFISLILVVYHWLFPVRHGAVILMYHSVGDNGAHFTVTPLEFARQMAYLYQHDFKVTSLEKFYELFKKGEVPDQTVVITFDDGILDNYLNAWPVLKNYNFPATIFVATGFVGLAGGERNDHWAGLPMLGIKELKELQAGGLIDLEPHTVTHPKLDLISAEEARREIAGSKDWLERELHKTCRFFAYPKGRSRPETIEVLRQLGFVLGLGVTPGLVRAGDPVFLLKRNSIDPEVSFWQFKSIVRRGRIKVFKKGL